MKKLLLLLFSLSLAPAFGQYCETGLYTSGCSFGDEIDDFMFGSFIDTATGCASGTATAYGNYTADTLSITHTIPTPVMVTANYTGQSVKIWIDFNDDQDFDDPGEEIMNSGSVTYGSTQGPYHDTITLPMSAGTGYHRMRVRDVWLSTSFTACSSQGYGEVHDYTVHVMPNVSGNCASFNNIAVDSISGTAAKINWTPGTSNSSFYLEYGVSGFSRGSGTTVSGSYPGAQPPVVISGLSPETTYDFYLGEVCNSGADSVELVNPASFSTTKLCAAPTNFAAANIGPYSADLSWNQAGSWMEAYVLYDSAGFDPDVSGNIDTATSTPFNLSGLYASLDYDVYLVTNCSGGNGYSDTIGPISITTLCAPITSYPYLEDFENTVTGSPGTFPNCWNGISTSTMRWQVNSGSTSSSNTGPSVDHTTDTTTGKYVYLETSSSSSSEAFLQTPEMDLTSLTNPELSFWYHMYGATMADLEVQASTDTGASWTTIFRLSGEQQASGGDPWKQATIDVSQFKTALSLFRFRGTRGASYTGDMAVDDVAMAEGPACPTPSAFVLSTTDTSATFNIIGGGSNYNVEWGPIGFTQGTGCTDTVANGVFTLDNNSDPSCTSPFLGNSEYDLYLRNDCGTNGMSAVVGPISFRTQCSAFGAPYSQNFDGTTAPVLDFCWSTVNMTSSSSVAETDAFTSNSASNSVELYNSAATSGALMLVSPAFSDMDTNKQVTFYVYDDDDGSDLIVGTMTDPADTSSFTAYDTITAADMDNDSWEVFVVTFENYTGSDKYIAFKHGMNSTYDNIYIDDVEYDTIPPCVSPLITSLGVNTTTTTTAEVYWTAGGANNWDIQYGTPGFVLGSGSTMSVTNDTAVISGLTAATSYEFYVRDSCGMGNSGAWTGPFQFTTALCDSSNGCVFLADLIDSYGDGWNGAEVSFIQNGIVVGTVGAGFTSGTSMNDVPVTLCDGYDTWVILSTPGGWPSEVGIEINSPYPIQVGSYSPTAGTGQGDTLAFFNASCALPTCPSPTNLMASDITDSSATISWDTVGNANSYEVWFGPQGFYQGTLTTGGLHLFTSSDSLALDSLTETTCYEYLVRAVCTPGDSSIWVGPNSFCTPCAPKMAPYLENFDALTAGTSSLTNCWNIEGGSFSWETNNGSTPSSSTGPQGDATSGTGIYLFTEASYGNQGDTTILESPVVDIASLSSPEMRFSYHMYGATIDTLHIDIFSSGSWNNSVMMLGGQQQTASSDPWKDTIIDLSSYGNSVKARFRAIHGSSYTGDISIDDVEFDDPITCPQPVNLDTATVGSTTATLTWDAGTSGNTSFEIEYAIAPFTQGNGTKLVVTGTSYAATNLTPSAQYCFYVREICGAADTSFWSGPYCFITDCPAVFNAPYTTNFEGVSIGSSLEYENCWSTSGTSGLHWETEDASGINENSLNTGPFFDATLPSIAGGTYVYLETSSTGDSAELYSPYIDVSSLTAPEVEYHYHMYGATINKLEVFAEDQSGNRSFIDSIVGQQQIAGSDSFWVRNASMTNLPANIVRLVFVGHYGGSYTGDISIDEVSIQNSNGCPEPSNLSITATGCDSLELSWTSNSGASIIEYGPSGFLPGQGTMTSIVSSPFTISGLTPGTSYDFMVADTCSGDTSSFAAPVTAATDTAPMPVANIQMISDSIANGSKYFALDASGSANATSYSWDFGNGTANGVQTLASYTTNGAQTIILTATNGCGSDTDTLTVNVDISLAENMLSRSLSMFPNPAREAVQLSFTPSGTENITVKVMDLSGKEVIRINASNHGSRFETTLNVAQLADGVYMIEISDGTLSAVRRLIKE